MITLEVMAKVEVQEAQEVQEVPEVLAEVQGVLEAQEVQEDQEVLAEVQEVQEGFLDQMMVMVLIQVIRAVMLDQ